MLQSLATCRSCQGVSPKLHEFAPQKPQDFGPPCPLLHCCLDSGREKPLPRPRPSWLDCLLLSENYFVAANQFCDDNCCHIALAAHAECHSSVLGTERSGELSGSAALTVTHGFSFIWRGGTETSAGTAPDRSSITNHLRADRGFGATAALVIAGRNKALHSWLQLAVLTLTAAARKTHLSFFVSLETNLSSICPALKRCEDEQIK